MEEIESAAVDEDVLCTELSPSALDLDSSAIHLPENGDTLAPLTLTTGSGDEETLLMPSEAEAEAMDISLIQPPPNQQQQAVGGASFRYPNLGGNFYTGIDVTSEVGVASSHQLNCPCI